MKVPTTQAGRLALISAVMAFVVAGYLLIAECMTC